MNFKVFFIAITFALIRCAGSRIKEPEQIGKQVFDILKDIDNSSKSDYIDNFFSIEEIRELGKNKDVVKDEDSRNEMTSMKKEKWIGRIEEDYNEIKEISEEYGIKWSEIEYLDFVYAVKEKGGIKGCECELYFKFNDKSFKIEISSIFNGKEYRLVEIEDLDEQQ